MKRIFALMLAFCMLMSVGVFANIELPLSVYVDGSKVDFPDAEPFVDSNSRTLVPVRFVSEALKATVAWDGNLRQVTITKGEKVVTLVIDKKEITVNGETKILDSAPIISESRTFVPIRFVSEALDATVSWDGAVRTVYISTSSAKSSVDIIDVNGFVISIKDGEELAQSSSGVLVKKKSGLAIMHENDADDYISMTFYKLSTNDVTLAKQEIEEIISQKFSVNTMNNFVAYLERTMSDKKSDEFFLVDENGLSIMGVSSESEVYISVMAEDAE